MSQRHLRDVLDDPFWKDAACQHADVQVFTNDLENGASSVVTEISHGRAMQEVVKCERPIPKAGQLLL